MRELFNKPVLFISIMILIVLVSLGHFLFSNKTREKMVCLFPVNNYEIIDVEYRTIPKRRNKEKLAELYLREIILGPVSLELAPLFPNGTQLNTVMLRDQVLYVDFSRQVMDLNNDIPMDFNEILEILERDIFFNFKSIEKLHVTIEGQIPGAPYIDLSVR